MPTTPSVPFPLGVMVGGPNGSDPAAEARIAAQFQRFTELMGAAPQFMNGFVDQAKPIAEWPSNASWTAWSWRQSTTAQAVIPVIGLPMATSADFGRRSAVYKEFAAGVHDTALRGVVEAWRSHGYGTLYIRPGYEMNIDMVPWYAGGDAGTRADWVAAFQHIASVVRDVPGVDVKVVWNPNIQAGNTGDVRGLYPGNEFVDVIAGDIYSPIYPRDLYSWSRDDGTLDATFAEWVADPVNRIHHWTYPAANQWNPINDGQSNTFSLQDLIDFARAHNKPIAIAETGVGGDGSRGPKDDPAFAKWLADTLRTAGVPIEFVNIWDLNPGDGDWDFTSPGSNKPLTAASWAANFGVPPPPPVLPNAIGDGPDVIVLQMSEDAFNGHAQFTVTVDGRQIGGIQSAAASHAAGNSQVLNVQGTFGNGAHTVGVTFLNNLYVDAVRDRNLYVDSVGYRGAVVNTRTGLFSNGTSSFHIPATAAPPKADTLVLRLSQDAYGTPAMFSARLDGISLGPAQAVTVGHGTGQTQAFTFTGSFSGSAHTLAVSFLNDAWGGSAATDRNLHIDAVELNGRAVPDAVRVLRNNGPVTIAIPAAATLPDTIVFNLSEDAWKGDAQCVLTVDGVQLGGVQTVTASHALGVPQRMAFTGSFGAGPHTATVRFLNDAYGGQKTLDRNLYVDSIEYNGQMLTASAAILRSNGVASFNIPAAQARAASVGASLEGTQELMPTFAVKLAS